MRDRAEALRRPADEDANEADRPRAVIGYDRNGQPIYDDDARFADGIGALVEQ